MIDLLKNVSLYIIRKICLNGIEWGLCYLDKVPDCLTTQEMYNKAVEEYPYVLEKVPDTFKTQEMCEKAFKVDTWTL